MTQALYDLAAHPEYVKEMREEAEAMIGANGWTKPAMQGMRKIDSFLKESQRLNGLGSSKSQVIYADLTSTHFHFSSGHVSKDPQGLEAI